MKRLDLKSVAIKSIKYLITIMFGFGIIVTSVRQVRMHFYVKNKITNIKKNLGNKNKHIK